MQHHRGGTKLRDVCFRCQMPLGHYTCVFSSSRVLCPCGRKDPPPFSLHSLQGCPETGTKPAYCIPLSDLQYYRYYAVGEQRGKKEKRTDINSILFIQACPYFMKARKYIYSHFTTISEVYNRLSSTSEKLDLQNTSLFFCPVLR